MADILAKEEGLWLFGYGSLIWKPPPCFDKRLPGYIEGYVRRFWQGSQDHRGTPQAPGRVVTLITREHWETLTDQHPTAPPRVWGAAYHIPPKHVEEVKEYLDIREINGYTIDFAAFHVPVHVNDEDSNGTPAKKDGNTPPAPINCLVYIGLPTNPAFVGPQDPEKLAEHIVRSRGPSGENKEYVYLLEKSLEQMRRQAGQDDDVDEHVADLARRVREAEKRLNEGIVITANGGQRGDGAEEVEKDV